MRLLQICSRKQVLLFLAVITLLSIFWTYWIASRLLQGDTTIPKEGYDSLRNKIRYSDEDVIFQVQGRISKNEVSAATEREISLRPNNSPNFVTRRSNIALEIFHEDGKLLQRLREVNAVFVYKDLKLNMPSKTICILSFHDTRALEIARMVEKLMNFL